MLQELETNLALLEDISAGIDAWQLWANPPPMSTLAGQQQTILSWDNFAHSFFHKPWHMLQMHHYTQNKI